MSSRMCEFHMRGVCRYGNKCRKSHNIEFFRYKAFNESAAARELHYLTTSTIPSSFQSIDDIIKRTLISQRKMNIEASMMYSPMLKRPDNYSKIEMEKKKYKNDFSVAMKTENVNSEKENASNFHVLHQKRMKKSTENDGSAWNNIIMSAIDNNLLCNICFEIFIKPTVLNCSHTFCESCIHVWTIRVINCPICRVEVKSKSYCLTLETFIDNIVEHLPKEFKIKREAEIKYRNMMKIERPQQMNHGFNSGSLSGLTYIIEQRAEATTLPTYHQRTVDRNIHFNADISVNELDMFRINSHDTVVSNISVSHQVSYFTDPEEQTSNRRSSRSENH